MLRDSPYPAKAYPRRGSTFLVCPGNPRLHSRRLHKAHDHQEVAELVSADVLRSLDPERRYGVWWFNRRQWTKDGRTGKHTYKWRPGASG
jgi:hypothetical protein